MRFTGFRFGKTVIALVAVTVAVAALANPASAKGDDIGSADNPIQLALQWNGPPDQVEEAAETLVSALSDYTGLTFEYSLVTEGQTITALCDDHPGSGMGFIGSEAYVFASNDCDVTASYNLAYDGWGTYGAGIFVPRDSSVETLEDLNGLTWYRTDTGSTSGYVATAAMLAMAGVTPGAEVDLGNHTAVATTIYNADTDDSSIFGSAWFSPYVTPEGSDPWRLKDPPDIPEELVPTCVGTTCSGYEIKDARITVPEEDVVQEVRILAISSRIPNGPIVFGPDFPAKTRRVIEKALEDLADPNGIGYEHWEQSVTVATSASGLTKAKEKYFDFLREAMEIVNAQPEP